MARYIDIINAQKRAKELKEMSLSALWNEIMRLSYEIRVNRNESHTEAFDELICAYIWRVDVKTGHKMFARLHRLINEIIEKEKAEQWWYLET